MVGHRKNDSQNKTSNNIFWENPKTDAGGNPEKTILCCVHKMENSYPLNDKNAHSICEDRKQVPIDLGLLSCYIH